MVKAYFSLAGIVEYMKKKEINKQSNKTRVSLHDFVASIAKIWKLCVYSYNKSITTKNKGRQKENTFEQMLAYICGINKLKWSRCLSLLNKILNLEEVCKKILKTRKISNLPFAFWCCSLLRCFISFGWLKARSGLLKAIHVFM